MKTIAQFVRQGIQNPSELKDALLTAMRLEFSTLPPYLCAEWFISGNDRDGVGGLIHKIVRQEMFHFGLAGNILSAINGTFKLTDKEFLPTYPSKELPGKSQQNLTVDLLPLSKDQLKVLMQIEKPEFDPVELAAFGDAAPPATIGEFYTELTAAIERQNPTFDQTAAFIDFRSEVFQITSVDVAKRAIDKIKQEGEGTPGMPNQPDMPVQPGAPEPLAHFYVFESIFLGNELKYDANLKKLVKVPGKPLRMPDVLAFKADTSMPNPSAEFNKLLSHLLSRLEACWTGGANIFDVIDDMTALKDEGTRLIGKGIRPEFAWTP